MSSNKFDGGPAFPAVIPMEYSEQQGKSYANFEESGMSLRDYFAAEAMKGMASDGALSPFEGEDFLKIARRSYLMADAMLQARFE